MVAASSTHHDRGEAIRRGQEGFDFFFYAINAMVAEDARPGRSRLWESFQAARGGRSEEQVASAADPAYRGSGIGTPDDMRAHLREFRDAGVDQVIFLQQAGHNRHAHICEALELFAAEVLPDFAREAAAREARKQEELRPWIERALARKHKRPPMRDEEIPVVTASRASAQINATSTPTTPS
jgi:GNAT superfamily N-acetyltransferase